MLGSGPFSAGRRKAFPRDSGAGRFHVGRLGSAPPTSRLLSDYLLPARDRQGVFQTHAAPSRRQLDDSRSVMSDDAVMAERGDLLDLRQRQDSLEL
jgi:hypothetical protein